MAVVYAGPKAPPIAAFLRVQLQEIAWNNQLAGQTLSAFDVVFNDGGFWKQADAHDILKAVPPFGIAQAAVASGAVLPVWMRAIVSNGSWSLTSGAKVFLASGGGPTPTPPTASGDTVAVLGWAIGIRTMELRTEPPVMIGQ
ncbi:MAG: hypothetical protein Q8O76_05900 [Chloroflexota bacterium]|nr:hypothetical protein [Chloroflexota bacterium]